METENEPALDADGIRRLLEGLSREEIEIFRGILIDVRNRGPGMGDVLVREFARKYADKARKLAGEGGR